MSRNRAAVSKRVRRTHRALKLGLMCLIVSWIAASALGQTQPPSDGVWLDVDRLARVETEVGTLVIRHRATHDENGTLHQYTIENVTFGQDGFGLTSIDLPIPRGARLIPGSIELPEGWGFAEPLPDDLRPEPRPPTTQPQGQWRPMRESGWQMITAAPRADRRLQLPQLGIAPGETARISFRVPRLPQGAVPYSQEISRYGTAIPVDVPLDQDEQDDDRPGLEWVDHGIYIAEAVEGLAEAPFDPDHGASFTPGEEDEDEGPLFTEQDRPLEHLGEDQPEALRHPDFQVAIDEMYAECGTLETGGTWFRVPVDVTNTGGSTSAEFVVRLNTSEGGYDLTLSGLAEGETRRVEFTVYAGSPIIIVRRMTVVAIADATYQVMELSEINNTDVAEMTCGHLEAAPAEDASKLIFFSSPNLAMTVGSQHAGCYWDPETETCTVAVLVYYRNEGTGWATGDVIIRFESAWATGEVDVGPLAPGEQSMADFRFYFSDTLPCDYSGSNSISFTVTLDPDDVIVESDESDNVAAVTDMCDECYFPDSGGMLPSPDGSPNKEDGPEVPPPPGG